MNSNTIDDSRIEHLVRQAHLLYCAGGYDKRTIGHLLYDEQLAMSEREFTDFVSHIVLSGEPCDG